MKMILGLTLAVWCTCLYQVAVLCNNLSDHVKTGQIVRQPSNRTIIKIKKGIK